MYLQAISQSVCPVRRLQYAAEWLNSSFGQSD